MLWLLEEVDMPNVKVHLSVILAALALVKAADYWLDRFGLTVSSRGVADGALYTDVNAQLPAINLLILISDEQLRFERPWAALLLIAVPLVWLSRFWVQRRARPRGRAEVEIRRDAGLGGAAELRPRCAGG